MGNEESTTMVRLFVDVKNAFVFKSDIIKSVTRFPIVLFDKTVTILSIGFFYVFFFSFNLCFANLLSNGIKRVLDNKRRSNLSIGLTIYIPLRIIF